MQPKKLIQPGAVYFRRHLVHGLGSLLIEKGRTHRAQIDDAYNADFYIPDPPWQPGRQEPSGFIRKGIKNVAAGYQRILSTDARNIMDKQGMEFPEYAGCIPLVDPE